MPELRSVIAIEGPPETVWRVLANLNRYADWNPFIQRASGRLQEDEQIEVYLKPPDGTGMTIKPRLLKADEPPGGLAQPQ